MNSNAAIVACVGVLCTKRKSDRRNVCPSSNRFPTNALYDTVPIFFFDLYFEVSL
jgi:hypothetical protein